MLQTLFQAAEEELGSEKTILPSMYPDCNVEIVNGSAGELTARIAAEAGNPQGDIMWGALSNSDGDTHKDIFEHWTTTIALAASG